MIDEGVQKAIRDALVGAGVTGKRVYDRVPAKFKFPYTTIGDEQVLDDGNSCAESWEVYPDIHIWSRSESGSKGELKREMKVAADAILAISAVPGWSLVSIKPESSRVLRDPDGITDHGVLTFKIIIDPA